MQSVVDLSHVPLSPSGLTNTTQLILALLTAQTVL